MGSLPFLLAGGWLSTPSSTPVWVLGATGRASQRSQVGACWRLQFLPLHCGREGPTLPPSHSLWLPARKQHPRGG